MYVVHGCTYKEVFLAGSYFCFSSYFIGDYCLQKWSEQYTSIPQEKRFYVIGNLIKAQALLLYTPIAVRLLNGAIFHDEWPNQRIKTLGCMYAMIDFVSLIVVQHMSRSTKIHHICVCIFNYFSVINDYTEPNACRMLVVYATFSTFSYAVNLLLGARFLVKDGSQRAYILDRVLSRVALLIYVTCCIVNWKWQINYSVYLYNYHYNPSLFMYIAVILFVVWDDLLLIRWLYRKAGGSGTVVQRRKD
jgi:hypothetical protein